jgi:PKD repeat protein
MKTKLTTLSGLTRKLLIAGLILTSIGKTYAQAPIEGGRTYYIDGFGVDFVAPKDTFINFMGAYSGGAYTNSTGLFNAITVRGVDPTTLGTINILLVPGYTGVEPSPLAIGNTINGGFDYMAPSRSIVIKPHPGANYIITTFGSVAANGALLRFNGVGHITIDGEGTPGQRNLTFQMSSGSNQTTSKIIEYTSFSQNGCQNIAIRNCTINGNSTISAINTYAGFYIGGTTTPSAPARRSQNITIENNVIQAVRHGVFARGIGLTANSHDLNLIVRNNIIGGTIAPNGSLPTTFVGGVTNAAGILIASQANCLIQGNTIRNCLPTAGGFRGIELSSQSGNLSLDSVVNINGNKIYNLYTTILSNGVYGIRANLGLHTQPLGISIINNTIGKIGSTLGNGAINTFNYATGILLEDNSANAGYSILHNSVYLSNDTLPAAGITACLGISNTVTGGVSVFNNIFANRGGRQISASGNPTFTYGIVLTGTTNPFSASGYNAFYLNDSRGGYSSVGFWLTRNRFTVAEWMQVSGSTNDVMTIPPFVNGDDSTLTISNGMGSTLGNTGLNVFVPTDINGLPRTTTPSRGAYQFTGNSALAFHPLVGSRTYAINGVNSWPVGPGGNGSFGTVADAIHYLNNTGVTGTGNISLQIEPGYPKESGFIPAVTNFTGSNASRPVILTIAPTHNDTITTPALTHPNYASALRLLGARHFQINGAGLPGQRNLTFALSASSGTNVFYRVIAATSTDTATTSDIQIRNCIIRGNSNTTAINTFAGFYHGAYLPTGISNASSPIGNNNNFIIENNVIEAVRNGVFVRGANIAGAQNAVWDIRRNIIGGDIAPGGSLPTTYIGGNTTTQTEQSGIMLKSVVIGTIDSNFIRNTLPTITQSNLFAGIRLEAFSENGPDSAITVRNNFIYNLTTSNGQSMYGIRINLGNQNFRFINILNNSIAKIRSTGGGTAGSTANPAAIFVEATATVNNLACFIYNNTINMSGASLSSNSSSSCLFVNSTVQGGLDVRNNIFTNSLGRNTGLSGNAFAINVIANVNPFALPFGNIAYNAYGVNAPNSTNSIGASNNASTTYPSIASWRAFTVNDIGSFSYAPTYLNDSTPNIDLAFAGAIFNSAFPLSAVPRDIYGTPRPSGATCVGAVQFTQIFAPLQGGAVYLINGTQNPPLISLPTVGSFATINQAIKYINANGVDGFAGVQPIELRIVNGYQGEGDTLITPLMDYPRMNANRIIRLRPGTGRNDTITLSLAAAPTLLGNNASLFRFMGGSFFTIDGSNNNTDSRNLTFLIPSNILNSTVKVIDLTSLNEPVQGVTIRNCNIIGQSTTSAINSFAGIYMGGITATPVNPTLGGNNNNRFENNYIGAVRYGIYLRGASATAGQQDRGNAIVRNIIGGNTAPGGSSNTDFIGGVAGASGIFLSAQGGSLIDSNVVRNTLFGSFNTYSGIELSNVSGTLSVDSGITISRNSIYNIRNSVTSGGAAYGIRVSLGNSENRNLRFHNNAISRIQSSGTSSTTTVNVNNVIGILVDATGTLNNYGAEFYYNSIWLSGNTLVNNATSACVMFGAGIRGGIISQNNIFQNTLGASAGLANAYTNVIGANAQIFSRIDNNNYFVGATNANNRLGALNATTTPTFITSLAQARTLNLQDTLSVNFVVPFVSDTNLIIPDGTSHAIFGAAQANFNVPRDIRGVLRSNFLPSMGVNEFFGSYADSVAPVVHDLTPASDCSNGPYDVTFRAIERSVSTISDTLYYSVNGGPEIAVTAPTSVLGFNRIFTIPSQSANTTIAYRYVLYDGTFISSVQSPATGRRPISTIFSVFPITFGFDLPNTQGWVVEQVSGVGGWDLNAFGSPNLPILSSMTGIRSALFPAQSLPVGTTSRLVSPCLDFTEMRVPTLRMWISQNADQPTLRDSLNIRVTAGGGSWSFPLRTIQRVNTSLAFPGYSQFDVCLSNFVGLNGLRVGIEAASRGGNNIVLDSIVIFDDVPNLPITPNPGTFCAYDSVSLFMSGTNSNYTYKLIDIFTNDDYTTTYTGNNGTIKMTALPGTADSLWLRAFFNNNLSACGFLMNDTIKVYIPRFTGGPYIVAGTPFQGNFGAGTFANPDGAVPGNVLTYNFNPPSGFTNAQYGSRWTIASVTALTANGASPASAVFNPPAGTTNGSYVITPSTANGDSTYLITVVYRLLPSNCDSVMTRVLRISSTPSASFVSVNDVCALQSISFANTSTGAPSTEPFTYLWDFGDGNTATTRSVAHTYQTGGTYTVTMTIRNNAGISATSTKVITVKPAPNVSFSNGLVCSGSATPFTNTSVGATSNVWEFLLGGTVEATQNTTNANYSFLTGDTTYTVKLTSTNSDGCINSASRQVYVFPRPVADFSTSSHCLGTKAPLTNASFILTAKPDNTFGSEWDFGNGQTALSNTPDFFFNNNGNFTIKLKVTTNFGCVDSATKTVTVHDRPRVNFVLSNLCQFDTLGLTNTTTFSGGLSKVSFQWDFDDNTGIVTEPNPIKVYGVIGNYKVKLKATDSLNACTDSLITNVNINQVPSAAFNVNVQNCTGTPVQFTNVSDAPSGQTLTYLWNFGDGTGTSTALSPAYTYTAADTAIVVKLTVTTNLGCKHVTTRTIRATRAPNLVLNSTEIDAFQGKYSFTVTPVPATPGVIYSWNFGDNSSTVNGTQTTREHTYASRGSYNVTVQATDPNGCISTPAVTTVSSKVSVADVLGDKYGLNISPNPFASTTSVNLSLDKPNTVSICVFDLVGRKVAEYNKGLLQSGDHALILNAADFSGVSSAYMVKVQVGEEISTRTIIHNK